jgi:hypothetical protein
LEVEAAKGLNGHKLIKCLAMSLTTVPAALVIQFANVQNITNEELN